jgi:hypothetical protein
MPAREPYRIRRLITVVAAVAAAGTITGLSVPSAMAAQPTAPAPRAAGSQEDLLNGVACRSANDCVAVGADYLTHTPLAESWNGTKWTRGSISAPPHTLGGFLDGVSCATASFYVATGAVFADSTGAEAPLIEGWNGKTWAIMKLAPPKTSIQTGMYAVSCPSADSCLTVGSGGNVKSGSVAYAEAWNGKTWALTSAVPWPKGTTDPWLYGVSCSAVGHCAAGGLVDWDPASNGTLTGRAAAATWNGKAWTPTTVTVPGKDNASGFAWVTCLPGKTAFCAAVGDVGPWGTGTTSTLSGFWNGKTWKVVLPVQ